MAAERDVVRLRRRFGVRVDAVVAPGTSLAAAIGADGDADRLLTRSDCRLVKMQRKVFVGRIPTPAGVLYVKRYNVFAWRVALASLWRRSPAFAAWRGAELLAARGFATPDRIAAIEMRRFGVLSRSFFVTREVADGTTADLYWESVLADPDAARRRTARRALARALGDLFRRLHAAGVYHADLKDVNVLVRGPATAPSCVLLDLERIRVRARLGRARRVKNLVQLARTLGPRASAADRARFLRAYLGDVDRGERRSWAGAVLRRAAQKDRGKRRAPVGAQPRVSCTIICQDEEATIGPCLESAAWCDEIVIVDGGSTDATVAIARRFTDRIFTNRWPGYRAQKQFALDHATGDWVLNLDADERVSPELATEIRAALAGVPDGVDGFAIPRLVSYLGRWWYRGGWYPRRIVRLVRRSATTWGGTDPHERAIVRGAVVPLREPILHYSYESVAEHLRSANTLTAVAARQERLPSRIGAGRLVAEPLWRFLRSYLFKRAMLNGLPGLFVSSTDAFYVFLRWAKVWERRRHERATADASDDLTVHGTRP